MNTWDESNVGAQQHKVLDGIGAETGCDNEQLWKEFETVHDNESSKSCTKCGRVLPLRAFNVRRRSGDGRRARCKRCSRAEYRDRYWDDEKFKRRRIAYVKKMYLRRHNPAKYRNLICAWKEKNELLEGAGIEIFTGTGQVARDLEAFTKTGEIELENDRESGE